MRGEREGDGGCGRWRPTERGMLIYCILFGAYAYTPAHLECVIKFCLVALFSKPADGFYTHSDYITHHTEYITE